MTNNPHNGRGDNPGVGGLPAEEPNSSSSPEPSRNNRQDGGDNPGVGGLPSEKIDGTDRDPG